MKAILCLKCIDFKALLPTGEVRCHCGNVRGKWYDGERGLALVEGIDREAVRVIGMHNSFLLSARDVSGDAMWRAVIEDITRNSPGYLFNADKRNCPVVIIRVGESSDVTWYDNASYFDRVYGGK